MWLGGGSGANHSSSALHTPDPGLITSEALINDLADLLLLGERDRGVSHD